MALGFGAARNRHMLISIVKASIAWHNISACATTLMTKQYSSFSAWLPEIQSAKREPEKEEAA